MNLKNALKNVDYKGLALQHCEKAVMVVVTALLVWFLVSGVKKAMMASSVTPERIDQLADGLNRSIQSSQWNESVAKQQQVENPDFKALIAELMSGIRPDQFLLAQPFFHFVDYGGILRQKPEILTPYHALAVTDKGALMVYKVDPKTGEFIEKEVVVRAVTRKKPEDDDKKDKKKKALAANTPKGRATGPGGSDQMMGGFPGGMMRGMGPGAGMGAGEGFDYGSMMRGMGTGTGMGMGMGMGMGDEEMMQGNIGSSLQRKTGSNIRKAASKPGDEFDDIDDQKTVAGTTEKEKGQARAPQKRKIREEEIKGVRWALITALFKHRDQVKKYTEAIHTADDPPNYLSVKVERREVLSDGSLSEWAPLDIKKLLELKERLPEKWIPENPVIHTAKADFPGLLMKLPELEVGSWTKYVRMEAYNSASKVSGSGGGQLVNRGRGAGDGREEDGERLLFGPGGASGPGAGAGASAKMMPGGGASEMMRQDMMRSGMMAGRGGNMPPGSSGMNNLRQPQTKQAGPPVQRSNVEITQVRFIDYTVEPEHTYQYRLKVVVKNPNYNRYDVINPDIATDKELMSEEWSEPTPLVYVPPDMEYYVLDRIRTREEAKTQVHVWMPEIGDWQFYDFTLRPGDPIGARVRDYQLVGWEDPPRITKRELDFSTQDLLLDVTGGDKPFIFEVDGAEIKFTERLPTEIFVVDRLGDLAVRNDDFDKNNVDRVDRVKYITDVREQAKANEDKDKDRDKKSGKAETGTKDDFEGRSAPSRNRGDSER